MPTRRHVVITGIGRCGTTFLVELLTRLGLDTGFSESELVAKKHTEARAGLEKDVRDEDAPYVVKSPLFCNYAEKVFMRDDIIIDHIFIPMRNLAAAAESRRYVTKLYYSKLRLMEKLKYKLTRHIEFPGGLWHTGSLRTGRQEKVLLMRLYDLLLPASDTNVPITLMRYPRITNDWFYLFKKLQPILRDIDADSFKAIYDSVVRPELVHDFSSQSRRT